jgi:hypothetical protein
MGFFEEKLAAAGRAFDSVTERAIGSNSPGALGRRGSELAAWLRERTDLLDDALAHRGIHVSTMRIARVALVALLVGVTIWSLVHTTRGMLKSPVVAVTPFEEKQALSLSNMIVQEKQEAVQAGFQPGPRAGPASRPQRGRGAGDRNGSGR